MEILFSSIAPKPVAYLDPGSGSLMLQIILATLLALGTIIRLQWHKIKALIYKTKPEDNAEQEDDDET